MSSTDLPVDMRARKAEQEFQTACVVTILFGGFRLPYALVVPTIVGLRIPLGEIIHGLTFLALGPLLSRRKWWCLWVIIVLSMLTIGYQLSLMFGGTSSGLVFLLVLGTIVFILNYRVLWVRRLLASSEPA